MINARSMSGSCPYSKHLCLRPSNRLFFCLFTILTDCPAISAYCEVLRVITPVGRKAALYQENVASEKVLLSWQGFPFTSLLAPTMVQLNLAKANLNQADVS